MVFNMKTQNKEFDIFGTKWKIEFKNTVLSNDEYPHEVYGSCQGSSHIIEIAKNVNGVKQTKEEMRISLLHEIFHAIFHTGQYNNSNDDEPLVEWCARSINSLLEQKII